MSVDQEMNCPECGAENTVEKTCETQYHECLVKEFTNAGYGAVHHLTVAAYMLQHSSKLSWQGWLETRRLLREFLIENKPPAEIRNQNKNNVDSGRRNWKITSNDGVAKINRTEWTKTILDVSLNNAEAYCADVTAWASAALQDSKDVD
jgi:Family of unknown function (DUF5946)